MKKNLSVLVAALCCFLFFAGVSMAAEISDPVLKKLVEKGVLTKEDAVNVMKEMEKDASKKAQKSDENIDKKASEVSSADGKDLEKIVKALKGFKFGLLWYLSYQNGETGDMDNGTGYSQFAVKRGYFGVTKELLPWFDAQMTLDVTTVKDPEEAGDPPNNLDGSLAIRIKYLYGKFKLPDFAFFTKPYVEVGAVHMPWLDFEEHVNFYRCQDTMFMERNGLFNSADLGATFVSLLGGEMPKEYQETVSNYYPGRYGSMSVGIYNGGGYTASEKNQNKPVEARLTVRPLPDVIPGLQLSYFGIWGKGNSDANNTWTVNNGMLSFEHEYIVLAGQYYSGKGQQNGANEDKKDGYSIFTEIKPHKKFSIIGRYDKFDPNTDKDDDENSRYIAGVAYHIDKQHKNMVLLDYDTVDYKQSGKSDDKRIQLTLQVAL
jgi:polyhydroxyalkanoate synthesis regulator phasin